MAETLGNEEIAHIFEKMSRVLALKGKDRFHLRAIARQRGLKVNEYGVFHGNRKLGGAEERDVYRLLKMPWIPPEMREDRGEIEARRRIVCQSW